MQVIFGVLVMFTGAAIGVVSMVPVCRFNQNLTCYGALGETLYLELDSEYQITFKNDSNVLLKYTKQKIINNLNQPRCQFIQSNRTITITSTERGDSGRYLLETYTTTGVDMGKRHLQLNIEAAVSSVEVKDGCFLSERRELSCSSEGDQLHFSWTLSGNRINPKLENENRTLVLEKDYVGNVTCYVQNHISHEQSTVLLDRCPGTSTVAPTTADKTIMTLPGNGTSLPVTDKITLTPNHISSLLDLFEHLNPVLIILGTLSVLLILLSIIVCHVYKKKRAKTNTSSSQNGEELLYAKVTHIPPENTKRTGRTTLAHEENVEYATVITQDKQKMADEVQYGEIVFNAQAARAREHTNVQEECTYAHVRHGR